MLTKLFARHWPEKTTDALYLQKHFGLWLRSHLFMVRCSISWSFRYSLGWDDASNRAFLNKRSFSIAASEAACIFPLGCQSWLYRWYVLLLWYPCAIYTLPPQSAFMYLDYSTCICATCHKVCSKNFIWLQLTQWRTGSIDPTWYSTLRFCIAFFC